MARIKLHDLRHSYVESPTKKEDWALQQLDVEWKDGGAYALLGPSGCGKTTLLNIISGLLTPSHGSVLFDDEDVTNLPPDQRHIAQVFQFPVIYDTMTVYDNLAFPLRNRGVDETQIKNRVTEIAEMIELTPMLNQRASGLTADGKQKISLGRGLVRKDVNVIMFDEPLTVIDPHLKWQLRSKLKELHQRVKTTMIYVTHDQTEALTFADQVVVMNFGQVVQIGTPVELFERPQHTFVGNFIGSPGMNILSCNVDSNNVSVGNFKVDVANAIPKEKGQSLSVGIRPEFIKFSDTGMPVQVEKVSDAGRFKIVTTNSEAGVIKLLLDEGAEVPADDAKLSFANDRTYLYRDGWLVNEGADL